MTAYSSQPRPQNRRSAVAATALALAFLACVEMFAYAPARDLLSARVWLAQALLTLLAAIPITAAAVLIHRLTARRNDPWDAAALSVVGTAGAVHLGPLWVPELAARFGLPAGVAGFALLAAALGAGYALARLLWWRRPRAGLSGGIGGLAVLVVMLAALRAGGRGAPPEHFRALLLAGGAVLGAATLLTIGRHGGRVRSVAAVAVIAAGLLGMRLALPNPHGWLTLAEPVADPRAGDPPPAPVIFVVLDTFRADALDLRAEGATPALAEFARRAHVVPDGVANASWTLPGHASLFTGQPLWVHRTDQTAEPGFGPALPEHFPTSHEIFGRAGHATACVAANGIVGPGSRLSRGCQRYRNPGRAWMRSGLLWRFVHETAASPGAVAQLLLELTGVSLNAEGDEIVEAGLDALDDGARYLFLNFLDVHAPFRPAASDAPVAGSDRIALALDYGRRLFGWIEPTELWSRNHRTLKAYYDGQAKRLDREIAVLFEGLEERGLLDPSVVLVTSDHGEGFLENPGRRGYFGHHSAWEPAVRIPLLVKRPGQREGAVHRHPFQQVDVLPTLLEAAGLPVPQTLPGAPAWTDRKRFLLTEWYAREGGGSFPYFPGNRTGVYEGRYKLVREGDDATSLYDLSHSPWEEHDALKERPSVAARLTAQLDAIAEQARQAEGTGAETDPALLDELRALGYVE